MLEQQSVGSMYTVVYPGKAPREFAQGSDAIKYLTEHPGYAKLFGPDGSLLMTKGLLPGRMAD